MRQAWATLAAALALGAATPASAAVIATGDYGADAMVFDTGSLVLGPGDYRFTLTVTAPLVAQNASVETVTNFFCVDPDLGPEEFPCGGSDVPTTYAFAEITPLRFEALVTVNPFTNNPFPAGLIVRYEEFDDCCSYIVDLQTGAAGSYTLSVAAVPEPATWGLLLAGTAAAGAGLRRRARALRPA